MQKIKLSIANRVYPLSVHPNQEEGLRKAAKEIDEMILHYEKNYAVNDKQDVLAMCALQLAVRLSQGEQKNISINSTMVEKLSQLSDKVSNAIDANVH